MDLSRSLGLTIQGGRNSLMRNGHSERWDSQVMMEAMCCFGGAAERSGAGPLPWLWGRKWCLKGEVGRESLFLEPTLLLHREEQSFCMPVRASAGRKGVRQGTEPRGPGSTCVCGQGRRRWEMWGTKEKEDTVYTGIKRIRDKRDKERSGWTETRKSIKLRRNYVKGINSPLKVLNCSKGSGTLKWRVTELIPWNHNKVLTWPVKMLWRPWQGGGVAMAIINRRPYGALTGGPLKDAFPSVIRALTDTRTSCYSNSWDDWSHYMLYHTVNLNNIMYMLTSPDGVGDMFLEDWEEANKSEL